MRVKVVINSIQNNIQNLSSIVDLLQRENGLTLAFAKVLILTVIYFFNLKQSFVSESESYLSNIVSMNLALAASVSAATQGVVGKNDLGKFLIHQIGPTLYPTIPWCVSLLIRFMLFFEAQELPGQCFILLFICLASCCHL